MAVTYASGTESTYKAGANVNAIAIDANHLLAFGLMAESVINTYSGFDWSTWYTLYSSTYPHVAQLLVDTATNLVATYIINYDMSGFTNIQEAVSRINVLYALYQSNLTLLHNEKNKDFVNRGGT